MFFRAVTAAVIVSFTLGQMAFSAEREFSLYASNRLIENGFIKFLLPRFSLKTGVRIKLQNTREKALVVFDENPEGRAVMEGSGTRFSLSGPTGTGKETDMAQRFVDWIFSDIGQRTIEQFTRDGTQVFRKIEVAEVADVAVTFEGDAARGAGLAQTNCGRCHVVNEATRMTGIGSTPSFALMRSLDDWAERFQTFYLRRPHPSFTQIEGVTDPFDPARPPPIYPLFMTTEALEDIFTFVSEVEPADLGADLVVHQ